MRLLPVLVLSLCVGACAAPGTPPKLPGDVNAPPPGLGPVSDGLITDVVWSWQQTTQADGRTLVADAPDRYTLQFQPGGRVAVRADCNRGMGSYRLDGGALALPPFALTKMMCPPDSLDREFLQGLAAVAGHRYDGGDLVLVLAPGSGTMRFRALPR